MGSYDGHVFTEERQIEIMSIIHGTYYLAIVMCQAVHIWTCRTMFVSIFEHGIFSNEATNVGVPISVAIGLAIVYFPPFQYLDGYSDVVWMDRVQKMGTSKLLGLTFCCIIKM